MRDEFTFWIDSEFRSFIFIKIDKVSDSWESQCSFSDNLWLIQRVRYFSFKGIHYFDFKEEEFIVRRGIWTIEKTGVKMLQILFESIEAGWFCHFEERFHKDTKSKIANEMILSPYSFYLWCNSSKASGVTSYFKINSKNLRRTNSSRMQIFGNSFASLSRIASKTSFKSSK